MSVVQRCPQCGTTKATAGECKACHEAQVRYFCTNHTPGLWLDGSTCPKCGARFGASPVRSSAPPTVSARTRPSEPPRAVRERVRRSAHAPPPRSRRSVPDYEEAHAPRPSPLLLWQQLLRAAIRARYTPSRSARYRERPAIGMGAGGCLKRLLLAVVLLFIALASGVFVFGRALIGY